MVRVAFTTLWLGLASSGCIGGTPGGDCPEVEPLRLFQSGTYLSEGGKTKDWYCDERTSCGVVFPPHDGATDLELEIAFSDKRVTIHYLRDGKRIEERWHITGRHSY